MEEPLNSEWHGKGEEQVRSTERTRRGTAVAEESIGNFQSKEPQLYHLHAEPAVRHDGLSKAPSASSGGPQVHDTSERQFPWSGWNAKQKPDKEDSAKWIDDYLRNLSRKGVTDV